MAKKFTITLLDAMVLLQNLLTSDGRHDDAYRTFYALKTTLGKARLEVPQDVLESLLHSSNINNEFEKFTHVDEESFAKFLSHLLPADMVFDRRYNVIRERRRNESKNN